MGAPDYMKKATDQWLEEINSSIVYANKHWDKKAPKPLKTEDDLTASDWKIISEMTQSLIISSLQHDWNGDWKAGDNPRYDDYLEYEEHFVSIETKDGKEKSFRLLAVPYKTMKCYKCKEVKTGYLIMDDIYEQKEYLRGCETWEEFAKQFNLIEDFHKDIQYEKEKGWVCSESHKQTYYDAYEAQPAWYKDELTRADGFYPSPRADY